GVHPPGGQMQAEPRLPSAAGTGECQETRVNEQAFDVDALAFTPNEARQLGGEVGRVSIERLERREFGGQIPDNKLEDVPRAGQVLEAMQTKIAYFRFGWQIITY